MYITGKHSIQAAALNTKRKMRVFYGSKTLYNELNLDVKFIQSDDTFLKVNEYVVYSTFDEIIEYDNLILLDQLEDPRNIGSIIRSAAAFNYGILFRPSCEINETVVRCAAGGVDLTGVYLLQNTNNTLGKLKQAGFWLVGLDEKGTSNHDFTKFDKKIIIIGSEGYGISKLLQNNLDIRYTIPTPGHLSTLNASVAASIGMYNLLNDKK